MNEEKTEVENVLEKEEEQNKKIIADLVDAYVKPELTLLKDKHGNESFSEEQRSFCMLPTIPLEVRYPEQILRSEQYSILSQLGFSDFIIQGNIVYCKFPEGWTKKPEDWTGWIYLIDNMGRKRAGIFYKEGTTVVKPECYMNYMIAYRPRVDHMIRFNPKTRNTVEHKKSPIMGVVIQWETKVLFQTNPAMPRNQYGTKQFAEEEKRIIDKLFDQCVAWCKENHPQYNSIFYGW